ncbi:coiled-coil domain-containing protein 149 isoform X1 [Schistocerca serialis cubense]|uniref:coiled-coil domain-containing protein 149 isoform X1 n=1 Tax=Schistocerca serialis cubense TaxID=2023355 RepID=UPI00214EB175|nr:coiled-coil domain-containing protein 149 isoform X1 [Schistocerca serialis cubense]
MEGGGKVAVEEYVENFLAENSALRRKLQSKAEALLILSKELDQCRTERDQFKLMAEQLQDRYSALKKKSHEMGLSKLSLYYDGIDSYGANAPSILQVLGETKEQNKALKMEAEDLKQKLRDAQGDIKVLREHLNQQRNAPIVRDNEAFPSHQREELVQQLETLNQRCTQMALDLQAVLDEKEDLVTERDAYKCKVHRLNHELHVVLKGDSNKVMDVDALVMENRYLQDRLQQCEEEKELSNQTVMKYKSMLDKKRNKGAVKLGSNSSTGMIMSHKQVQQLLENGTATQLPNTAATVADLKSLCLALLEALGDKTLALSHQKKANRILAGRIKELEYRLERIEGGRVAAFPSQILLEGYSSATVDREVECLFNNDSSSEGDSSLKEVQEECVDDSMEPSHQMEQCSKMPGDTCNLSAIGHLSFGSGCRTGSMDENTSGSLEDCLPPQLQLLVQKALEDIRQQSKTSA